ncbi:hypothetical protein [Oligoflexus tunisiensis]|uniref:hypothetical protein n=1 Tax=Oligoflexus tunisiensis TaxID=708132 RepID=UPI000A9201AD|nr:hypothetical protein [Oligoflexus tunisiensis]
MSQLFRLKNGTVLLSTEAPGGIYNSGQLKKIAELCSKELAIVKATEDQRLALFVKESEVENVAKQLRAMGLGFRHYQDSLHQPVSCLGELCEDHEQPAMATAMDITKEIASLQVNAPLKIGINGCARCCTPCHTLDIAVVGDSSGYRISLGGKTRQMPEFASYFAEGVPAKELPKRLKAVIETYKNLAEDGETLHDVIERCGVTDFVKALAPYSQDAAQREDPFAQEAATVESVDDLALPADEFDEESLDDAALDLEDSPAADQETNAAVEDDLSIMDESLDNVTLDEIPIERGGQGSLEDDLSLGSDDASLELNEVDFSEDDAEPVTEESLLEEELSLDGDDLTLDPAAAITEDDIDLEAPELESLDDSMETMPEVTDDIGLDEPMNLDDAELTEDLSMDLPEDIEDGDMALSETETPMDEDLEAIPELDEDLAMDDLPEPAPAVAKAATPAPAALSEDFGEELPTDVPELSDEEENQFEQKLQASIDEESALIAKEDKDTNLGDRAAALSLLENSESQDDDLDAIELDDSMLDESMIADDDAMLDDPMIADDDAILDDPMIVDDELEVISSDDELETIEADGESLDTDTLSAADVEQLVEEEDEVLEPINETMEEFPEPGPTELAHINSRQHGQKLQSSVPRQQFKVSAITFQDEHMRVTFDTSAYVDFDLSALGLGEERNFRLGVQSVSVTSTTEGYILEVDGMRLFHPKTSFPAAS